MEFTFVFIELFFKIIYLVLPLILALDILIIALGLFVGHREKWRKRDSVYWAFITATTVGYGDIRPTKNLSRALSILIAFIGLMLTGIFVGVTLQSVELTINAHPIDIQEIRDIISESNY